MEQAAFALVVLFGFLAWNEISALKKKVQGQEERINQLAQRMGQEDLSSCWVSDEVKERVLSLKKEGKEVEAVKTLREHTEMTLLDAKRYVDRLN